MLKPIRLSTENFLVLTILVFSALMRLWNIESWTFTNDELSAINRVKFDSLSALFEKGINPDAHPAGTQLLLYYWTKLFGYSEIAVRLPFVFFSLLSTFGIYLIGKKWVHSHAGLTAATLFAGLGYTVTYSILARPYALGTFAIIWALFFWTTLIRTTPKSPFLNYLGLSIFMALCAYTHYFAATTASFIYLIGFFIIPKIQRKHYIFSGIFALLFFLPHLSHFVTQFSAGGGGTSWLGVPEAGAILSYLAYCFNESWILVVTIGCFLLLRLFIFRQTKPSLLSLTGIIIFSTTICFAFFYSLFKAPIFQYSILIFGFIGLLISLADLIYFPEIKSQTFQIATLIIVLTATTVFTNDFRIESRFGTFEKIALHIDDWSKTQQEIQHFTSINSPHYLQYYLDKHDSPIEFDNFKMGYDPAGSDAMKELVKAIGNYDGQYISYSKSTFPCRLEAKEIIKCSFPKVVDTYKGENCEATLFSKGSDNSKYNYRTNLAIDGESADTYLFKNSFLWRDFGITHEPQNCKLVIVGQSKLTTLKEAVIVLDIKRNGKALQYKGAHFWRGSDLSNYVLSTNKWAFCTSVVQLPEILEGGDELSIYIYNPNNILIGLRNYEIKISPI